MDVREKLVELFRNAFAAYGDGITGCTREEFFADFIAGNGVTLLTPAKQIKKMTNGQKIRSMSDEELAVFVRSVIMAEDCPATGCDCDECFFKEPCFNGPKWHSKETEWLKQPAGKKL